MKKVVILVVVLAAAGFAAVKFFGVEPPKITRVVTGKGGNYGPDTKRFGIWEVKKQKKIGSTLAIKIMPEGKSTALGLDFLSVCKDVVESRSSVEGWQTMKVVPYIKTQDGKEKKAGIYTISKENWDMYVEKGKRGDLKQYTSAAEWTAQ